MPATIDALAMSQFVTSRQVPTGDARLPFGGAVRLLNRAAKFPERERVFLEMLLKHRLSHRQIAACIGIHAGSVARAARGLIRKLHDPVVALLSEERSASTLPKQDLELAEQHVLLNRPLEAIAADRGMSAHVLARQMNFIRGYARGRADFVRQLQRAASDGHAA
jgi:hypothetical protein